MLAGASALRDTAPMLTRALSLVAALLLAAASVDAHAYARPLQPESARRGFAAESATAPRARDTASADRIKEKCRAPLKCASSLPVDAWGNVESEQVIDTELTAKPNRIGFTGYQLDRQTSEEGDTSYYAKARHYSAGSGAFLSVDPWSGDANQPLSYNKYLYGYANPGVYVDPDGRNPYLAPAYRYRYATSDQERLRAAESAFPQVAGSAGIIYGVVEPAIDAASFAMDGYAGLAGDAEAAARAKQSVRNTVGGIKRTAAGMYEEGPYDYVRGGVTNSYERIDENWSKGNYFEAGREGGGLGIAAVTAPAGGAGIVRGGVVGLRSVAPTAARVVGEGAEGGAAFKVPSNGPGTAMVLHQDQSIINNYKRYYAEGWERVKQQFNAGKIKIPAGMNWQTVLGQKVDAFARQRLHRYLEREEIPEGRGEDVLVNRWLRDPTGSGEYRIPDVRLKRTETILDGTIGKKTLQSPQIEDMVEFSGGDRVIIVRPRSTLDSAH